MKEMINMYKICKPNPCPYYFYHPMYNMYPCPYCVNPPMYSSDFLKPPTKLKDYGNKPFVINIDKATKENTTYRTALWTGDNLQVTLMSINVSDDIGLETHPSVDQFIRIEEGQGIVKIGDSKDNLNYQQKIYDDYAIMIPAGKWHNVINTGNKPLKLYAIYAPPEHPSNTVHKTKADAEAAEKNYGS